MWLRDWLASDLEREGHKARILTYGYDSKPVGSISDASISSYSRQFLEAVKEARRSEKVIVNS